MQELNEKLARWAGFRPVMGQLSVQIWSTPDGVHITRSSDMPDFTSDLNACFKWLVPKLQSMSLRMPATLRGDYTFICDIQGMRYSGHAQTPALALCRAIEQLIDKERE